MYIHTYIEPMVFVLGFRIFKIPFLQKSEFCFARVFLAFFPFHIKPDNHKSEITMKVNESRIKNRRKKK